MNRLNVSCVVATRAANEWANSSPLRYDWLLECQRCHAAGDWGDVGPEDRAANIATIRNAECRLLSAYRIPSFLLRRAHDDSVWIITDDIEVTDTRATTYLVGYLSQPSFPGALNQRYRQRVLRRIVHLVRPECAPRLR